MDQNKPIIPCGEFAVIVNISSKVWQEIRSVGALRLMGPGYQNLRAIPPGNRSNGYPVAVSSLRDLDYSVQLSIQQLAGDRRVMTVWRQHRPGESVSWKMSLPTVTFDDPGPFKMVMYPELEKLLEYLISLK